MFIVLGCSPHIQSLLSLMVRVENMPHHVANRFLRNSFCFLNLILTVSALPIVILTQNIV